MLASAFPSSFVHANPIPAERSQDPYLALLPFTDARHPTRPHWLAAFLDDALRAALIRQRALPLLPQDAARQRVLGVEKQPPPPAETTLRGTVQQVLGLVNVSLTLHLPGAERGGALLPPQIQSRLVLAQHTPAQALGDILRPLYARLWPQASLPSLENLPDSWKDVEQVYSLIARMSGVLTYAQREQLIQALEPWTEKGGFVAAVHGALGELELLQALGGLSATLDTPNVVEDPDRKEALGRALAHFTRALRFRRGDTGLMARKGATHFFLKEHYQAKTEASIARLRNPYEGLAYLVIGLSAGLSSGEGRVQLARAQQVEPTLRTRVTGSPPYLGGIFSPYFRRAEKIQAQGQDLSSNKTLEPYQKALKEALTLFEASQKDAGQFDKHKLAEAETALRKLTETEEGDFKPWLYLARVQLARKRPYDAAEKLRLLAADYPQQWEILFYLGQALNQSEQYPEAENAYRVALGEEPAHGDTLLGMAHSQLAQKKWNPALLTLRKLLQLQPDSTKAWLALAEAREGQEDIVGARAALHRVLELEPDHKKATHQLKTLKSPTQPPSSEEKKTEDQGKPMG